MEYHQTTNDSTTHTATTSQQEGQKLSQYANALDSLQVGPDTGAQKTLPALEITDNSAPSAASRSLNGAAQIAEALGQGVGDQVSSDYHTTVRGAKVVTGIAEDLSQHPAQIAAAADAVVKTAEKDGGAAVSDSTAFAHEAVTSPVAALTDTGHALAGAASAAGSALETAGSAAVSGAEVVGKYAADHPVEMVAIAGAAAIEVASVGTATPVLATVGAIGAGAIVHTSFNLADSLNNDSQQLSVLTNADSHSQSDLAAARQKIAADTGGDVVGLGLTALGVGAAKGLSVLSVGTEAEGIATSTEALAPADQEVAATVANGKTVVGNAIQNQVVKAARADGLASKSDRAGGQLADNNAVGVAAAHPTPAPKTVDGRTFWRYQGPSRSSSYSGQLSEAQRNTLKLGQLPKLPAGGA